jgi:citrate synthase
MEPTPWKTALTDARPNAVRIRGYAVEQLMGRLDFGQAVYLLLRGELPDERAARLINAILVSCIDHGPAVPSTLAARTVASTGGPLSAAVAAGILAVNAIHGGAIEGAARALLAAEAADAFVRAVPEGSGGVVPGFGHRIHTHDPRAARLFELAAEAALAQREMAAAREIEAALERRHGRRIPLNIDGAIAAVLLGLGFEPEVMNGFFMLSRAAGLIAHAREETVREHKMRSMNRPPPVYDGPAARSVTGTRSQNPEA